MSDYDAASVVGQMVGLDEPKTPVPPSALIARFAGRSRTEDDGTITHQGFCGLTVIGSRDSMVSGFDDGYDFMGFLGERGWRSLAGKGDWPYVVYLRWPASESEPETIIEYCEADFTAWQFPDHDAARALYASLRNAP